MNNPVITIPMIYDQVFVDIPQPEEKPQDELERELLERQTAEEPAGPMEDFIALAIRRGDERAAAILTRRYRNALLSQSDQEMSLDRLNLTMPKGLLFTDWLKFFQQIAEMLTGDWAKYRQALRDIPQQEGFPFNVTWPKKPGEE